MPRITSPHHPSGKPQQGAMPAAHSATVLWGADPGRVLKRGVIWLIAVLLPMLQPNPAGSIFNQAEAQMADRTPRGAPAPPIVSELPPLKPHTVTPKMRLASWVQKSLENNRSLWAVSGAEKSAQTDSRPHSASAAQERVALRTIELYGEMVRHTHLTHLAREHLRLQRDYLVQIQGLMPIPGRTAALNILATDSALLEDRIARAESDFARRLSMLDKARSQWRQYTRLAPPHFRALGEQALADLPLADFPFADLPLVHLPGAQPPSPASALSAPPDRSAALGPDTVAALQDSINANLGMLQSLTSMAFAQKEAIKKLLSQWKSGQVTVARVLQAEDLLFSTQSNHWSTSVELMANSWRLATLQGRLRPELEAP